MLIEALTARGIFDSRGVPTVEVFVTSGGVTVRSIAPSGTSAGEKEALEKRDKDGKGVNDAIHGVNSIIASALVGREFGSPQEVDELLLHLDGSPNKRNLGSNATLPVSVSVHRAFAETEGVSLWRYLADIYDLEPKLPRLYMNIINGGVHAENGPPFQEYMIIPAEDTLVGSYDVGKVLIDELTTLVKSRYGDLQYGKEGGLVFEVKETDEPFALLREVIGERDVDLATDVAASEFYQDGKYVLLGEEYSTDDLLALHTQLTNIFGILSVEDPFDENDVNGFKRIMSELGGRAYIVADDLTVTNASVLKKMIKEVAGNALIIKPNQVGTIKETMDTVRVAKEAGWECVASHRSGGTTDTFISDVAVAIGAYGIKAGSPTQIERRVKYERLLEIEQEMIKN